MPGRTTDNSGRGGRGGGPNGPSSAFTRRALALVWLAPVCVCREGDWDTRPPHLTTASSFPSALTSSSSSLENGHFRFHDDVQEQQENPIYGNILKERRGEAARAATSGAFQAFVFCFRLSFPHTSVPDGVHQMWRSRDAEACFICIIDLKFSHSSQSVHGTSEIDDHATKTRKQGTGLHPDVCWA